MRWWGSKGKSERPRREPELPADLAADPTARIFTVPEPAWLELIDETPDPARPGRRLRPAARYQVDGLQAARDWVARQPTDRRYRLVLWAGPSAPFLAWRFRYVGGEWQLRVIYCAVVDRGRTS